MSPDQRLLLALARDNAGIARQALESGALHVAREHLRQALKEIDHAEGAAQLGRHPGLAMTATAIAAPSPLPCGLATGGPP